jgi:hypothetical protein
MIEGRKLSHFGMFVLCDLYGVTIGFIEQFLCGDFANDLPFGVGLSGDQTSKFIFCFYNKRIHGDHHQVPFLDPGDILDVVICFVPFQRKFFVRKIFTCLSLANPWNTIQQVGVKINHIDMMI